MSDTQGVIAHVEEDGFPVLYRYNDEVPSDAKRDQLQWLTVITWSYDRHVRNGMPPEDIDTKMVRREDSLEDGVVEDGACEHIVSRTGNGKKELVYYIHDRDAFIGRLNDALARQPVYPIEIDFYHDPEWKEFAMTRSIFESAPTVNA